MKNQLLSVIGLALLLTGCSPAPADLQQSAATASMGAADVVLRFPTDKYPETGKHIADAIAAGESAVCTIDRSGADKHRDQSLKGIPTKAGYDRDEWPMAFCQEGGEGANIEYVHLSDNRGAGAWVSNQLDDYPDGTKVLFVFDGSSTSEEENTAHPAATATAKPKSTPVPDTVLFKNCTAVRDAGKAPLHKGDPGYSPKLDRDGDGIACE